MKEIHITTQAEYYDLCMGYLSADQYASRYGCHLATAYRHFKAAPEGVKALVTNDITGSQYTVIRRSAAHTLYTTQQRPGNPNLTTEHQRAAAWERWHGK